MPLALRKTTANCRQIGPTHSPRPYSENSAVLNSSRANFATSNLRQFLTLDRSYFILPLTHRRDVGAYYCGKKLSRAAASTPARAAQGMATRFRLRKVLFEENRKFPGRTADSNRRATLANDYGVTCSRLYLARYGCFASCHRHPWRLWLASDHAHQLAVCLSSLRSYYLS